MIHKTKPKNFNPHFRSVGCFIDFQGKILLLHRQDYKPQGNTWGLPSGKVDGDESIEKAILREVKEETGIGFSVESLSNVLEVYVRYLEYDFIYYIFYSQVKIVPEVLINNQEHKAYKWVTPSEALKMDLIEDLDSCIKMYYK
jgi:8-oxo-dGTP pyrophosphatase MutT (NUDIX family)